MERLQRMPVPVLPTFVGALTLSNVYAGLGYSWVRHVTMIVATVVWILYLVKIIRYPKTCQGEYKNVVPCSLYAAFFMMLMILGSYYAAYAPAFGKGLLLVATFAHAIHISVFTYRNVIKERNIKTFVPSWFVTYNGIMVSCVVGAGMGCNHILVYLVYYGIAIYLLLIPIMIWRLCKVEIGDAVYHTVAVVLAPVSLCLVSYLNIIEGPNQSLVYFLYICVLASLVFVVLMLPKFFRYSFTPGYAGLTFPMAIGIVASNKMAGYLLNVAGNEMLSKMVTQIAGIQIYLTTILVGYVLLNFLIMALKLERK
ncbi:MAG: TDT family transporter [Acetivibrio ethanolgignens]